MQPSGKGDPPDRERRGPPLFFSSAGKRQKTDRRSQSARRFESREDRAARTARGLNLKIQRGEVDPESDSFYLPQNITVLGYLWIKETGQVLHPEHHLQLQAHHPHHCV